MFCIGLVGPGARTSLCVASKRTVFVYEVNNTNARHSKVKEIQCPGTVQYIDMKNGKLYVGYPSNFAIYSIQGDEAPLSKCLLEGGFYCFLNIYFTR